MVEFRRNEVKLRFSPIFSLPSLKLSFVDDIRKLIGENESKENTLLTEYSLFALS